MAEFAAWIHRPPEERAQAVRTFAEHGDTVASACFSSDGTQALSGSLDGTVRLWDIATGWEILAFSGHEAPVLSAAFSPDGKQALSASGDNTIKLWNITP